jgi:hypothetical protein
LATVRLPLFGDMAGNGNGLQTPDGTTLTCANAGVQCRLARIRHERSGSKRFPRSVRQQRNNELGVVLLGRHQPEPESVRQLICQAAVYSERDGALLGHGE